MSLTVSPLCLARSATGPSTTRGSRVTTNPVRRAVPSSRRRRPASAAATSASLTSGPGATTTLSHAATTTHAALFELASNANDMVDGCGVTGTCGQVDAPPFALIGAAILVSAAVFLAVTFGLKGGTDAASEMKDRDSDFFGKK